MLGSTIGALSGGQIMKFGRRKAMFISCVFGLVGVGVTYHMSLTNLLIGRIIYGIATGLFSAIAP